MKRCIPSFTPTIPTARALQPPAANKRAVLEIDSPIDPDLFPIHYTLTLTAEPSNHPAPFYHSRLALGTSCELLMTTRNEGRFVRLDR